jgi:hypothetical protein
LCPWFVERVTKYAALSCKKDGRNNTAAKCGSSALELNEFIYYVVQYVDVTGAVGNYLYKVICMVHLRERVHAPRLGGYIFYKMYWRIHLRQGASCPKNRGLYIFIKCIAGYIY